MLHAAVKAKHTTSLHRTARGGAPWVRRFRDHRKASRWFTSLVQSNKQV